MVKALRSRRRAESKPAAGRRSAALEPIEAPKHLGSLPLRDARTGVRDLSDRPGRLNRKTQADDRRGRGMMKGILDEVGEELREQFAIPIDLHVVRDLGPERAPALFGGRGLGFGNRAHHVGEGHRPRSMQLAWADRDWAAPSAIPPLL
jgi:hypothetical protein